jgi:hypothetical protein
VGFDILLYLDDAFEMSWILLSTSSYANAA